ncbi:kinesin-like protein KIN-14J [Tripterygium wilfordii]|uniref:kinesin-like protein KIN-14J n=1 Tax=Tripterygium wilfordii TaxID=458696 RepID=UPI0018F820C7|nr:kinesin-like protein KIN-14J [Tripterygium wilfordii]XP_038725720.1 kinesin-like protein KIN-14J [Tripterygium wilfordii]
MEFERHNPGYEEHDNSNGAFGLEVEQAERPKRITDGEIQSLAQWLNYMLPHLDIPLQATEEELRASLIDGTALCSILNEMGPGSVELGVTFESGAENVKRFLAAVDEMGLPTFELSDLEQGHMVPVFRCLRALRSCLRHYGVEVGFHNHSRKRWNLSEREFPEGITCSQGDASTCGEYSFTNGEDRQGSSIENKLQPGSHASFASDAKILELVKSNGLDDASTQSLFRIMNGILDERIEQRNEDVTRHMAIILRKVVQIVEQRMSVQAENSKKQNNLYKARDEKYRFRINVLETLATGTTEENEVAIKLLQRLKIEKTKIEQKEKLEEQDLLRLKTEKSNCDIKISKLKKELEMAKATHERHCLQVQAQSKETKADLENKLKELEWFLTDSRKNVKELESFSESKYRRWKKKEQTYQSFIDHQLKALQELRAASESTKHEALKAKRTYAKEFNYFGLKLKGLTDAAENYHVVLAENRKLYNEVQDLKGNIRVYCRIRPFLRGQNKMQTTIEYMGENGELVVSNPSKQVKDSHRIFKFNKVFGPASTQEEVFLDTQPLIRSVLDGYNVCIFAYGQTGSGKTYTMSGPNMSLKEEWGVNYRALHDLFFISESRQSSILYEVGVQMVEIYNEQVRDLLSSDGPQKRLGIWNSTQPNGLAVPNASLHPVKSTNDVLELMNVGLMNRAVGATALNDRSSRSHSVLTVHVRGSDLRNGSVLRGCLHLVDLAGSERVDRSEATGDRLREAQHINKSLSALGDVIFALAQKSSHVPYRNSKLTQLLQSSLGGQAKTLMFVQLNPDVDSYLETISTLKFAERVSGVELGAARSNKEGREIKELMEQVALLKDTVARKDEEIDRLLLPKSTANGVKHSLYSLRYGSSSPRRQSVGTPRQTPRLLGGKGSGPSEKAASDMDNCSEYSDKHSEDNSQQTMDDFKRQKESLPHSKSMDDFRPSGEVLLRSKLVEGDVGQTSTEDIELLGFGEADSDERLSDISDSGLSMGTETDGSIGSVVEFTLFPEKPAEKAKNTEKPYDPSKLPKPPQKVVQTKPSRLSSTRASSSKVPSSLRKTTPRSSSLTKSVKR